MRKNTRQAAEAFAEGLARFPAKSVWSDGNTIWSYGTAILTRDGRSGELVLNATKYSATTSTHQNGLREYFRGGIDREVDGLIKGSGPVAVLNAAKETA